MYLLVNNGSYGVDRFKEQCELSAKAFFDSVERD